MIDWLLEGPSWIQYNVHIDLLDKNIIDPEIQLIKNEMVKDIGIQNLIEEVSLWPNMLLKRHNDATHLLHKMTFLADIGLKDDIDEIKKISQNILNNLSKENIPQVLLNIPTGYGGKGIDEFAWILCDAPLVINNLLKFENSSYDNIKDGIDLLLGLKRENGWPCTSAPQLGKFRGPGRKADPCPYAHLLMLKLLSVLPKKQSKKDYFTAVDSFLKLWDQRQERRPYLFAMGANFSKLKAPFIWYDILHTTDILSQFPWIHNDDRFQEMIDIIRLKQDIQGRYTAESIWRAWSKWEFGQKKFPSRWITFLITRIMKRIGETKVIH